MYGDAPVLRRDLQTLRFHRLSRNLLGSSFMVQVYLKTPQETDFILDAKHYAGPSPTP